jgi:hypothetical protein
MVLLANIFRYKSAFSTFVIARNITKMAKIAPTVKLNNGYDMPLVGLGTYLVSTKNRLNDLEIFLEKTCRISFNNFSLLKAMV